MSELADVAMIGLGVMGTALARNLARRGHKVALLDRDPARATDIASRFAAEGAFVPCTDPESLTAALREPRRILVLVPAGAAVDSVLDSLAPHLTADDIVVDAGNSHFAATEARAARARKDGFRFMGMGVSGGERGALEGPAMMPGGDPGAWKALQPILESVCAFSDSGPCVAWCGNRSAGHFVKMVHNGIEYGDMQLIAECWTLMKRGLGLDPAGTRDVFEAWNAGRLRSFLVEITAQIVGATDPIGGGPLVEAILDMAGQKGTGRWTSISAVELGVPLPTVTAAVDARALSAGRTRRLETSARFEGAGRTPLNGIDIEDLEAALYCSKLASYAQGFDLLRTASAERGYNTDLAAVSRIWKAGCIIRAAFLDKVHAAFEARPALPLLILDDFFADQLQAGLPAWRRVVAAAAIAGIPAPAMSASLAWFDTLSTARGSASLIQAQRDLFGAHTYRRFDRPDFVVHTIWDELEQR